MATITSRRHQNVKIGTFTIEKNDIFRNEYGTEGYKYGDTISFCAVIEGPKGKTVAGNWECDPISEGTVQLKINGVPWAILSPPIIKETSKYP